MIQSNSATAQLEELKGLVLDEEEQEVVKGLLKSDPKLWRAYGNMHDLIRGPALDYLEDNSVEKLCVIEGLKQMKLSLLAEGSSPLEIIAIDQIINNHVQVIRSGYELERFEPDEENQAASKHWLRVHNAAQARLIKAVTWLTRLRKLKVDEVIKRTQNKFVNFESEFAKSLKNIDKQMDILERLDDGEELTDEELGIVPDRKSNFLKEFKMPEADFSQCEDFPGGESLTDQSNSADQKLKAEC